MSKKESTKKHVSSRTGQNKIPPEHNIDIKKKYDPNYTKEMY